jgi:hypothetical protein
MAELPLDQVPREGEIVEVLYRLSRPTETHLDLTVSEDGALRRLRFNGARVVMFQEEPPPVLKGLDVQDIRDQQLRDMFLHVSIADGAITFWAKTLTEITQPRFEPRPARDTSADDLPVLKDDDVRQWGPGGVATSSFRYQSAASGSLRGFSVGTGAFVGSIANTSTANIITRPKPRRF